MNAIFHTGEAIFGGNTVHKLYSLVPKRFTFLDKMFCTANPIVAARALTIPTKLKDSSVTVAMATPPIIGMIEQ